MLNNLQKKRTNAAGFTIIEVLIVLAIAGLILLVVFLAVPALQRNAHNTTRKSDIQALLGGMTEYISNNGGAIATTGSGTGNSFTIGTAGSTNTAEVKLGQYDPAQIKIQSTVPTLDKTNDINNVYIVTGATCSSVTAATTTGATKRSFAALYVLEGGALQCTTS